MARVGPKDMLPNVLRGLLGVGAEHSSHVYQTHVPEHEIHEHDNERNDSQNPATLYMKEKS